MVYTAIGIIVGMIMGLTGAGGAMISIPLYIGLLDSTLKEATVLSLVAVVFGTAVNLLGQMSKVNKSIALSLSGAGALTNYLSLPLKAKTPDMVIAGLLGIIGIYSITSVLRKSANTAKSEESNVIVKALIAGSFLGLITTLTGLGGGVILVPILIRFFGKDYKEALPTSLATILIISLTAFFFQSKSALNLISFEQLGMIGGGAVIAYFLLKILMRRFSEGGILLARKIVFTIVTVYSVVSVIIKAM